MSRRLRYKGGEHQHEGRYNMLPMIAEQSLILHPQWAEMEARRRRLRDDLAGLHQRLEEQSLLADHLQARFSALIGPLEIERLRKQAECAYLCAKHMAIAKSLNRGHIPSTADMEAIEREAQQAREKWDAQLSGEIDRLRQGRAYVVAAIVVSDEIWAEVKRLYRKLCRRLHPDISDVDTKVSETYWPLVQQAYRSADVELLATLEQIVPDSKIKSSSPDSWTVLRRDIHRLEALLRDIIQRLADNERQPPLCYAQQLNDPDWINERRNALKREIAALEKERVQTLLEIERITANTTVH